MPENLRHFCLCKRRKKKKREQQYDEENQYMDFSSQEGHIYNDRTTKLI